MLAVKIFLEGEKLVRRARQALLCKASFGAMLKHDERKSGRGSTASLQDGAISKFCLNVAPGPTQISCKSDAFNHGSSILALALSSFISILSKVAGHVLQQSRT